MRTQCYPSHRALGATNVLEVTYNDRFGSRGMEGNSVRDGHVCEGGPVLVCLWVLEGKQPEAANEECAGNCGCQMDKLSSEA